MRKLAIGGMFLLATAGLANAADPLGEWRDEDGKATIKIVDCNSRIWGVIASEKTPGTIDKNNPDRAKRSRTTLGMPILLNMAKVEDEKDKWEGEIYDPIRGKVFASSIQVKSANSLRVEGCVAMVLCGGQTWTRIEPGKSGFNYGTPAAAPAPAPGAPKSAAPFPAPVGAAPAPGAIKSAPAAGAKGGVTTAAIDPATAQICALPEIASAPRSQ